MDSIAHKIIPVAGYSDLSHVNQTMVENNDQVSLHSIPLSSLHGSQSNWLQLRSIVLLNCGALVNLSDFLTISDKMKVYVFDSHRPINLDNAFGSSQVSSTFMYIFILARIVLMCFWCKTGQIFVMDDGLPEDYDEIKKAFELLEYDAESDEEDYQDMEEDGPSEDEDLENSDNEEYVGEKRKRSEFDQADAQAQKRKALHTKRRQRRDCQRLLYEYYAEGTSYGAPTSSLLYNLSKDLSHATNDMLWQVL